MADIYLNVGGTIFQTTTQTLSKFPDTKLGSLKKNFISDDSPATFFFDRNPEVFNSILDLYRTGELHFPSNFCGATIRNELKFWQIDTQSVSECCLESLYRYDDEMGILSEIKTLQERKVLDIPEDECQEGCPRNYLWKLLQYPASSRKASIFSIVYLLMVLLSTTVLFISTSPDLRDPNPGTGNTTSFTDKTLLYTNTSVPLSIWCIDIFCGIFFTLEFIIRVIVTPQRWRRFFCSLLNVVDMIVIMAFWIFHVMVRVGPMFFDRRTFSFLIMIFASARLLQLCRFYRFMNRFSSFDVINLAARASVGKFGILIAVFTLSNLFFGYLIYYVEFDQRDSFNDAFVGFWWAVVTMTTVGYGDIVPSFFLGRFVAMLCALTGILILAMPVAIVTSNFTVYYAKLKQYTMHRQLDTQKENCEKKVKVKKGMSCKTVSPISMLNTKPVA